MKKILVINANPKTKSLTKLLSKTYADAARKKNEVQEIHIGDLTFDMDLHEGYDLIQEVEKDLLDVQDAIKWADHIAIFTPIWWGTIPAKFKGLIDRIFLPNYAFKYIEGKDWPLKLLKGRTSEIIMNMDTPVWWYRWFQGNVAYKHLKITILDFVGIKNKRTTYLGPVISAREESIEGWINKSRQLGLTI